MLVTFEDDILVGCDEASDLSKTLAWADSHGLAVQPEAVGALEPWPSPIPVAADAIVHRFGGDTVEPRHEIVVSHNDSDFLWTWRQDGKLNRQKRVGPGAAPRTTPFLLPGASPRLLRHLGRHGMARVGRFHSTPRLR